MINIPTNCPVCDSTLVRINDQLFCKNSSCDAKTSKNIRHFVKTLKIKGLGDVTLEKLELASINDLYLLTKEELVDKLGEKIGNKIYLEIEKSKKVPLSTFIQSFGIPLIGNSASTKLAKVTDSLWTIDQETSKKAGLGDKATNNLLQWIKENSSMYSDLPITTTNTRVENEAEEKFKVVITGKLKDFSSRNKAKTFLKEKGVSVVSGVSSKVDYVICDESKGSSSETKAKKMNIPLISMNELLNIIKGDD